MSGIGLYFVYLIAQVSGIGLYFVSGESKVGLWSKTGIYLCDLGQFYLPVL